MYISRTATWSLRDWDVLVESPGFPEGKKLRRCGTGQPLPGPPKWPKSWTLYCLYSLFLDIGLLFWALLEVQVRVQLERLRQIGRGEKSRAARRPVQAGALPELHPKGSRELYSIYIYTYIEHIQGHHMGLEFGVGVYAVELHRAFGMIWKGRTAFGMISELPFQAVLENLK